MSTKHTPGPWRTTARHVVTSRHGIVAITDNIPDTTPDAALAAERGANARLIAAAPDLLDALRSLANYINADPDAYEGDDDHTLGKTMHAACAAIAKAEKG